MRMVKKFAIDYIIRKYHIPKKHIHLMACPCAKAIFVYIFIRERCVASFFLGLDELKLIDRDFHTVRRGLTCADHLRLRTKNLIITKLERSNSYEKIC